MLIKGVCGQKAGGRSFITITNALGRMRCQIHQKNFENELRQNLMEL